MLLIFIQLVCCSIKDIYLMGIHKIKWKYIWNFGLEMFGGTAAFPEHCRSAVAARAFHCHQTHLSTSPLIFSLLSPYVFQAIITVHSPEHHFFFHHWTHISVKSKCLNFYELYLIWLNTTEGLFGSLLFSFYFPNKVESGNFFVSSDRLCCMTLLSSASKWFVMILLKIFPGNLIAYLVRANIVGYKPML